MEENTKKIAWLQVLLAIATAIGLSAIYFVIKGDTFNNNFFALVETLIPNLIAVLIAIPVIYFLFTVKGISPEDNLVDKIGRRINGKHIPIAEHNLYTKTFREHIQNGSEILIVGMYLTTTINENHTFFEKLLRDNKKITFIILDPNDDNTIESTRRKFRKEVRLEANQVKDTLNIRINQLKGIKNNIPKRLQKNIKIKTINYPIPFGGYLVKTKNRIEMVYVRLYGYQTQEYDFLQMRLIPERNNKIFNDFVQQFNNFDRDAKEII